MLLLCGWITNYLFVILVLLTKNITFVSDCRSHEEKERGRKNERDEEDDDDGLHDDDGKSGIARPTVDGHQQFGSNQGFDLLYDSTHNLQDHDPEEAEDDDGQRGHVRLVIRR